MSSVHTTVLRDELGSVCGLVKFASRLADLDQ